MQTRSDITTASLAKRYLIASVAGESLAFPAQWVTNILVIERSQILALPFYNPRVLGVIHHQGNIVPLVLAHPRFTEAQALSWSQSTLMAVRLDRSLDALAGVGVVIERLLGSLMAEQLTTEPIFQPDDLPDSLWQPQLEF